MIADDIAFGHETIGGFQRVFEDAGGKVVQKLFSPLSVPDYSSYLAQLKTDVDGLFIDTSRLERLSLRAPVQRIPD